MPTSLVTLTTDFGSRDAYVAVMKAVMLGIHPGLRFIDISHEVPPQDLMAAAFILSDAAPYFPAGTIHLAVVDPGVGTSRPAVALRAGEQMFVGPDNGLFPLVMQDTPLHQAVVLDRPAFWRTPSPSATFHGRDIFAPVAAHLAAGRTLTEVGTPAETLHRLHWPLPLADEQGVQGWVLHVDRFGNAITNISRAILETYRQARGVKCYVGSGVVHGLHRTYGDVEEGDPLLLFGSSELLEIAVHGGNAARLLSIKKGTTVNLVFG